MEIGKKESFIVQFFVRHDFFSGGVLAFYLSNTIKITFLIPFAAGNFLYIGAADLIPEIKKPTSMKKNMIHSGALLAGLLLLLSITFFPYH